MGRIAFLAYGREWSRGGETVRLCSVLGFTMVVGGGSGRAGIGKGLITRQLHDVGRWLRGGELSGIL